MGWWIGSGHTDPKDSHHAHAPVWTSFRARLRQHSVAVQGDEDISRFPTVAPPTVASSPVGLLAVYGTLVGAVTGAAVAAVAQFILLIERLAFGGDHRHNGYPPLILGQNLRLVLVLFLVGLTTAVAWALLDRYGAKPVSVPQAMVGKRMPPISTTASILIQAGSVAGGVPIGRENAPRLAGAMLASWFSHTLDLDARSRRLLVACAAGAGLSASFHLPLAGALFTIELLLVSASTRAVVTAMMCSAVATAVSGLLGTPRIIYDSIQLNEHPLTLLSALLVGAIAGIAGEGFGRLARRVAARRWKGWKRLVGLPLVMFGVGIASLFFIGAGGNGRYVADVALAAQASIPVILGIIVLRVVEVTIALRTGAIGGMLTPSFSLGAMVGLAVGLLANPIMPFLDPKSCALIGAAAFLSTTMAAPLFGLVAAVEFTDQGADGYLAMFVAVVAATLAVRAIELFQERYGARLLPHRRSPMTTDHPAPT